jgi:protocatechuate 3,4-dioxygenase beta subunit
MANPGDDATIEAGGGEATPTRRTVVKAGAGAAALALGGGGLGAALARAQDATPGETGATPAECVLTPQLTEGPYYVEGELIRRDITEGKPGVPLALRIAVQDITACAPLANAAVEIWHCDAQGYYSGIVGENPGGGGQATGQENATTTFLRGVQLTEAGGTVEFATIYPGWYTGRTPHIHMKVHVEGTAGDAASDAAAAASPEGGQTYQGGHTSHVGQLFFDDATSEAVFATEVYARSSEDGRIGNEEDNIFGEHGDEPGFLVELTGSPADGFTGTITVGVDPTAIATEGGTEGGPGGPGGPPGGPGGTPPGGPPPGGPGGTPPAGG